jgi:uncharacterized integral membrane protein (TIGR00698 family)
MKVLKNYFHGLALTALATVLSFGVAKFVPSLNASTVGVVLGAITVNFGLHRERFKVGTKFASHRLLRIAVVLLGFQLSLGEVAHLGTKGLIVVIITVTATFVGTQAMGRALGVSRSQSLLIAAGFSICGVSAIKALEGNADARDDEVYVAIALVTLFGSIAIILLPALQGALRLDARAFGAFVGASVHDVGQTVATANRVAGALPFAIVVKLTRVILLAPMVAIVGTLRHKSEVQAQGSNRRPSIVPLFVIGFVAAILLRTSNLIPTTLLSAVKTVQQILLVAALFGLGTGIEFKKMRRTGGRAFVLGIFSWVLIGTIAYFGVRLQNL